MRFIVQLARVITGLLFIFSGVIKLNDPSGFSIKLHEYFDVFAQDVSTRQDTLKLVITDGAKELGSKAFMLYAFDKERELLIQSSTDTTQEVQRTPVIKTRRGKSDTFWRETVNVSYEITVNTTLGGQSGVEAEFDLPDSLTGAMFNIKVSAGNKGIFQKDYKVSAATAINAKTTLNLKDYVKKESWLNGFFKGMNDYTLILSVLVCALEVILGFALIVGWRMVLTSWLLLLLIVFFTFLTGYSWLSGYSPSGMFWGLMIADLLLILIAGLVKNPKWRKYILIAWALFTAGSIAVTLFTKLCFTADFNKLKMKVTDCGCFGDFMHLEPSQSFFKDIILLALILIIFFGAHHIKPWFSKKFGWKFMTGISLLSAGFGVYCYLYLPVWDFLPYKKGNDIKKIMHDIPPGMRASDSMVISYMLHKGNDSVEIPFIAPYKDYMEKTKQGWKTDGNSRREKIIIEGYKTPIHDFVITDPKTGGEMKDTFLNSNQYQLVWVMPYLDKAWQGANKDMGTIAAWAKGKNYRIWALTSSGPDLVESWNKQNKPLFSWYFSDQKTLLTIARYAPTLYLFKGPVVVQKWSGRFLPSVKSLEKRCSQ